MSLLVEKSTKSSILVQHFDDDRQFLARDYSNGQLPDFIMAGANKLELSRSHIAVYRVPAEAGHDVCDNPQMLGNFLVAVVLEKEKHKETYFNEHGYWVDINFRNV